MSGLSEGYRLSFEEMAAVLSVGGMENLVNFRSENLHRLTGQGLWSACCSLVRDGILLQSEAGFSISPEFTALLIPALEGKTAMVMTPGSEWCPQMIYYGEGRITALERSHCGGYVLTALDAQELEEELVRRLELVYPQESDPKGIPPDLSVAPDDNWETLLRHATMVLEQLELCSGRRIGWLRIVVQGIFSWIQWYRGDQIHCEPLERELLVGLLQQFQEGAMRQ